VSDTGTDPATDPVSNPEGNQTPNPFNVYPNDLADTTEDPTTVEFNSVTTPATISLLMLKAAMLAL